MKYKAIDGKIFEAETPQQLIEAMRNDSFSPGKNTRDFMLNVSESSYHFDNSNIRINTPENFVQDLLKNGFLEEIK